jgi:ketopantoate reductase
MRVLIVGAGSVGVVLSRAIEQQKGNDCTFLVRAGRKPSLERFKILDARNGELRIRERPAVVELGQVRPGFDTVLFCVRGDQLAAALDDLGALPAGARLATVTPGPEGLALLRARHPGHPAARVTPAFAAYSEADTTVLWIPPLVKSAVCWEEDASSSAFAEELADAFEAGGVPARARARAAATDLGTDAFMPLLAAYAIADYDADALTADRALLDLTGEAIGEALRVAGAPGIAGALARRTAAPMIRAALGSLMPRLPDHLRIVWRVHAPKIEGQTRGMIEALVQRGHAEHRGTAALTELLRRMDARTPAEVQA